MASLCPIRARFFQRATRRSPRGAVPARAAREGRGALGRFRPTRASHGPRANSLFAIAASPGRPHCSSALRRSDPHALLGKGCDRPGQVLASAFRAPARGRRRGSRRPHFESPPAARTARPVRIMSRALDAPTARGRRTVPPSISGTPQRRQKTPNVASSSTTRRSHHSASSSPPATAYPATAATTGFDSAIRVGPIGPAPSASIRLGRPSPAATRSAPAQKVPPSPQSTATRASASRSNASKAATSASAVSRSTAFLRAGRERSPSPARGPSRSERTASGVVVTRRGPRRPGRGP